MENKQDKNLSSLKGIKTVEEGKRFESYIGWSFSKELKCEKYLLGVGYSLKEEKDLITHLLEKSKIKIDERQQIIINLDKYEEEGLKSLSSSGSKLSKSESKSDKNIITSSENSNISDPNMKNDLTINNEIIITDSKKNNKDNKDKEQKK